MFRAHSSRGRAALAWNILALLAAACLVAPGIYFLGLTLFLRLATSILNRFQLGPPTPPTPAELANQARNARELASMLRQALAFLGSGLAVLLIALRMGRHARETRHVSHPHHQ